MCTGPALTGVGRSMARGLVNMSTMGISHVMRRTCKGCEHPMSEHRGQSGEMVVNAGADVRNERPQRPANRPMQNHPWDVEPEQELDRNPNPARWVPQPDGRYSWWTGYRWSGDSSLDPTVPDPTRINAALPLTEIAAPEAAAPATTDLVAQLKQLAELRDAGILTEDEFAAKKTEILSRM